jgi:predicted RNase H-like HicB family nuclease
MERTIKAYVYRGDTHYVAECMNIAVVTQGKTLDETIANLREAVALYLEGEDPAELGLVPDPGLVVTLELEPAAHAS